jgi:hypothetical protein
MEPLPAHMKPNSGVPSMMFVDGENLVMRWQKGLEEQEKPPHISHEEDVYVWSQYLNARNQTKCNIIRRHYYTSAVGDDKKREGIFDELQSRGIEEPHVFPRTCCKTLSTPPHHHLSKQFFSLKSYSANRLTQIMMIAR